MYYNIATNFSAGNSPETNEKDMFMSVFCEGCVCIFLTKNPFYSSIGDIPQIYLINPYVSLNSLLIKDVSTLSNGQGLLFHLTEFSRELLRFDERHILSQQN